MYRVINIFTGVIIEADQRKKLSKAIHYEDINFPDGKGGWIYRKNWKTSKTFYKYYAKTYRQLV